MTVLRRAPRTFLLLLFVLCLTAPIAVAGSADDPEITDPEGDQEISGGGELQPILGLLGESDAFDDVDILAAWINETSDTVFFVTVRSAGPVQDDTRTLIHFNITVGPDSVFGSTASGEEFTIDLLGTDVESGPDNLTVEADGDDLTVFIPRASVGASGGDRFGGFFIERSRSTDELAPLVAPGQEATDRAPDDGFGRPYAFERPPAVPAVTLTVQGGQIVEGGQERVFLTPRVNTMDGNATVTWNFAVRNLGTDVDTVTVTGPAGVTLAPASFALDPGQTGEGTATLVLDHAVGTTDVPLTATSARGETTSATPRVTVLQPVAPGPAPPPGPGPDGRTPVPAGLTWLSPVAEGMGLDSLFGDYAELVLLALLVLLLILAIVLVLLLLARRREVEDDGEGPLLTESSSDIRHLSLQQVGHHPKDPRPGEAVTTSLVLANTGLEPSRARLVLVVDGRPVQEKEVDAPAKGRVRVRFPWVAGPGENRVKVQLYPA